MEPIPFIGFDSSGNRIMSPFLWNTVSERDWDEETISSALLVDIVWDLAYGFPFFFFSNNILGKILAWICKRQIYLHLLSTSSPSLEA
jgi:hypothetical protein